MDPARPTSTRQWIDPHRSQPRQQPAPSGLALRTRLSSALTALSACFHSALAVLGKIARIVLGTAATMAMLAAPAPSFGRASAVVGEIPGAVESPDVTGAGCLLTVFGEIASIAGMWPSGHSM